MDEQNNTRTLYIVGGITIIVLTAAVLAWQSGFIKSFTAARMPSLERPTNFPADFPEEAKQMYNDNVAKTKENILKDPTILAYWFDLAIQYRTVGDYDGAVQVWEYVSATHPTDGISLHNLGEHYFHNEEDYKKAERYYRKSIDVAPNLTVNYTDLHEMYRYVYKQDTTAAADILKEGIRAVEAKESIDLSVLLGTYYVSVGNETDALAAFTAARDGARSAGNPNLVRQIDKMIADLKK